MCSPGIEPKNTCDDICSRWSVDFTRPGVHFTPAALQERFYYQY